MNDSHGKRRAHLAALRKDRAASFRKDVFPYFRYVMQSGFGLLLAAAAFAGIIGYAELLQDVPERLPAGWIGAVAIAIVAIWSPLRTYMGRADTVFLLPMEGGVVRHYLQPALRQAAAASALRVLAVYLAYIPLYGKAPATIESAQDRPLWLIGLLFAVIAVWNIAGGWFERRTENMALRWMLRAARIAATFLLAWSLLNGPLVPALGVSAGCMLLLAVIWRAVRMVRLPWERLIREEMRTVRRWRRFLSWFVDVPTEADRPARRSWAAWLGDRLPWKRERAWHYWYAKTFARGETFGAWFRWQLVIGIVLVVVNNRTADWVVYAIGFAVGGIQLTELASIRMDVSLQALPVGQDQRRAAAAAVARTAGVAGTVLLWGVAALPHGLAQAVSWTSLALLAAGLGWNGWLIPRRIAKPRDEDD